MIRRIVCRHNLTIAKVGTILVAIRVAAISLDRTERASVVLANLRLILRNVGARSVGHVEGVEFVLNADPFTDFEALAHGKIKTLLSILPEDIALSGGEAGLIRIGGGDSATQPACWQQRKTGESCW